MLEEFENNFEQNELAYQIERFEAMLRSDESGFFDTDVFEDIIDHYLFSNQLKKAMRCVDMAIHHYPLTTVFKLRKAQILLNSGKLEATLRLLDDVEHLEPGNEELLVTKAAVYSQQKKVKLAIEYFEKALETIGMDDADELYLDLAIEYENNKEYHKAIDVLTKALSINPENESALYELAYCYETEEKYGEAIKYYEYFIDQNPYSYIAWYNLGNAYSKLENFEKAVWAYDYCNIIFEGFLSAFYNKGNALCHLENFDEAIEAYRSSLTNTASDAITYNYIGECYEKLGAYREALEYYRKAIDLNPELPEPWLGIGVVYDCMNRHKSALPYFEKVVKMEEDNPDAYILLAEAYKKCKKDQGLVETTYLNGLAFCGEDKELNKAYIQYLTDHNLSKAIEVLEKYILEYPDGEMSMLLVKLFWDAGRFTESLLLADQELEKDFNSYNSLLLHFPDVEKISEFVNIIDLNRTK